MAKTVGFNFAVGARMASSVGSVFNTVSGRTAKLKGELKQLHTMSASANKLTTTGARVSDLRAQAAAGKDVKDTLSAAERAYASAQKSASKYNLSVADAAKVHAQATAQIKRTEAALQRQQTLMRNTSKRQELQGDIMGTIASVGIVVAPIKMAIDFESAFADVKKVVDFGNAEAEKGAQKDIRDLSAKTGLSAEGIAQIYAAAGEAKIATTREELKAFATTASTMAVAFGVSAESAGGMMTSWRSKMGMDQAEVLEMADALNHLGNNMNAPAAKTALLVESMGAVAKAAGLSETGIAALSASFVASSKSPEIAATGMKNFLLALTKGEQMSGTQQDIIARLGLDPKTLAYAMQEDAEGTITSVMEALAGLDAAEQGGALAGLFGGDSVESIQPLLTNMDLLRQAFGFVADEAAFTGSMQEEYKVRSETTAASLARLRRTAESFGIALGSVVLPAVVSVAESMTSLLQPVIWAAESFPIVTKVVFGAATALVALKVGALAGGYALTLMSDGWQLARGAWALGAALCNRATYAMIWQRGVAIASAAGLKIATVAIRGLNLAMSNNPIGWFIKGIAAVVAILPLLYNSFEPVRKIVDSVWGGMKAIGSWFGSDEEKEIEIKAKTTKANIANQSAAMGTDKPSKESSGWFSGWFGDDDEDIGTTSTSQKNPDVSGMPDISEADSLPSNMPLPAAFMAQSSQPTSASGGTTMPATLNMTINIHGIPDKDMSERVMDSLRSKSSEVERFFGELIKNQNRVAYD